jgi:hypothetical protein
MLVVDLIGSLGLFVVESLTFTLPIPQTTTSLQKTRNPLRRKFIPKYITRL